MEDLADNGRGDGSAVGGVVAVGEDEEEETDEGWDDGEDEEGLYRVCALGLRH